MIAIEAMAAELPQNEAPMPGGGNLGGMGG